MSQTVVPYLELFHCPSHTVLKDKPLIIGLNSSNLKGIKLKVERFEL